MIVVTGGAGFIGSALVHGLNQKGIEDIWLVDDIDNPEKQKNIDPLTYTRYIGKDDFLKEVTGLKGCSVILHMGACSSTTETDLNYLRINNFEYTQHLAKFALEDGARFIYASSAATYGDGEKGYDDDDGLLETLVPLNPYGDSKPQFGFKIPMIKDKVQCQVFDQKHNTLDLKTIKANTECVCILHVKGLKFLKQHYYLDLYVSQVKIFLDGDLKYNILDKYSFNDVEEEESELRDLERDLMLDEDYLNRQSFWFDLKILRMTVSKVAKHDGVSH